MGSRVMKCAIGVQLLLVSCSLGGAFAPAEGPEGRAGARAPLQIHDVFELQNISLDLGGNYQLANDIDASATEGWNGGSGFTPIDSFDGVLDGKLFRITGLYISRNGSKPAGLFGEILGAAVIRDVRLAGAYIQGGDMVGGLAAKNNGTLEGCSLEGSSRIISDGTWAGGLAGANSGTVRGCFVIEDIRISCEGDRAGGLVGDNRGTIDRCNVNGTITGDCHGKFGGVAGHNLGSVTNCMVAGTVSGTSGGGAGGVAGNNSGTITNCTFKGEVASLSSAGGMADASFGCITYCLSSGRVSGRDNVGGIAGYGADLTRCSSTGRVSGSGDRVGGLVGSVWVGSIEECSSSATVTGGDEVGGLVGANFGNISRSYSTGMINGSGMVGGLAGRNDNDYGWMGVVQDCFNTGPVSGADQVGGAVGLNVFDDGAGAWGGAVLRCWSNGTVTAGSNGGGLVGNNSRGDVLSGFFDNQTSGLSASDGGTGMSTADMKRQATFAGWDFNLTWVMTEGETCPYLRWAGEPAPPAVNHPPTIHSELPTQLPAGTPFALELEASDPDWDPLAWSLGAGPSWLSLSGDGLLSGTPPGEDVGVHSTVALSVSDGRGGTAHLTFTFTVTEREHRLVWALVPGNDTMTEGDDYLFALNVSDSFPEHSLSFLLYPYESGTSMTINRTRGMISWLDVPLKSGPVNGSCTYTFTVNVTCGGGLSIHHTFTLTVRARTTPPPVNREPLIVSFAAPENVTVKPSQKLKFSAAASDPDGDSLTYEWRENGTTISTKKSFTRKFTPGNHTLVLLIGDGRHFTTRTFNFTVAPGSPDQEELSVEGFEAWPALAAMVAMAVVGLFWRRERR